MGTVLSTLMYIYSSSFNIHNNLGAGTIIVSVLQKREVKPVYSFSF